MSSPDIGDSTPQRTSVIQSITRWFARVESQSRKRRAIDGLLSLDDHLLADIGLSRDARTYMAHHRLPSRRSGAV